MSDYKQPAVPEVGIVHEQEHALIDVRDKIWERGETVQIRLHEETTVERDKFNSIKRKLNTSPRLNYKAFPITFNPTEEEMKGTGLKERCEVVLYTAMLDWNGDGYTLERLEDIDLTRASVIVRGAKYEIADKALHSQFYDTYLYVILGLNRK